MEVVIVTENELNDESMEAEIVLSGMSVQNKTRPSRESGVLLCCRTDLHVQVADDPALQLMDSLRRRLQLRQVYWPFAGYTLRKPAPV